MLLMLTKLSASLHNLKLSNCLYKSNKYNAIFVINWKFKLLLGNQRWLKWQVSSKNHAGRPGDDPINIFPQVVHDELVQVEGAIR